MKNVRANEITTCYKEDVYSDDIVTIFLDNPVGYYCFLTGVWVEDSYVFESNNKCVLIHKGTYVRETWDKDDGVVVQLVADPKPIVGKSRKDIVKQLI